MNKAEEVKSVGGIAPFGYKWQDGKLVIDGWEAPVRKLIYELFLKHRRKKTVAKLLNDAGYLTSSCAKFSDTTIDRLLRDTTAKGIRVVDDREIKVEPIIEIEIWERANDILNSNSNQKITKQAVHLFSGITFCACGGKMIVPGNSPKYICTDCRHKIGTDDLEEIFHSQLKDFVVSDEANLYDYWQHLTGREKRIIVEQICDKIIVGKTEIEIEFGYSPNSLKTVTFGQQNSDGNETQAKESTQEPPAQNINEPLLSEAEAARFLGISKMTLLRRRNAGEIGFFRVGFRVLYSKEKHLIPFLEQCEK